MTANVRLVPSACQQVEHAQKMADQLPELRRQLEEAKAA